LTLQIRQSQLHPTASRSAPRTPQPPLDGWDGMVGAEGADQSINVEFDRIGAFIADSQKGVTGLDVG
jgi:hypothetical protein